MATKRAPARFTTRATISTTRSCRSAPAFLPDWPNASSPAARRDQARPETAGVSPNGSTPYRGRALIWIKAAVIDLWAESTGQHQGLSAMVATLTARFLDQSTIDKAYPLGI